MICIGNFTGTTTKGDFKGFGPVYVGSTNTKKKPKTKKKTKK